MPAAMSPINTSAPPSPPTTPLSQRVSPEKRANLTASGRRTSQTNSPGGSPSPGKLRRKVSVEDAVQNVSSIQRLVEYFIIISCHPRIPETAAAATSGTAVPAPSPKVQRPVMQRGVSAPIPSSNQAPRTIPEEKESRFGRTVNRVFRKPAKTGTEHALAASFSNDSQTADESRAETLPPPKPRGTWKRDVQEENEGNIHMPEHEYEDHFDFQPKITSRYPLADHQDNPLNPMVTQFCHPVGDVVVPTTDYEMPRVHHFVLTNDKGRKLYGTCLTIMEEYEPPAGAPHRSQHFVHSDSGEQDIEVSMKENSATLYLPRCVCILSMWPYMDAFREYLAQLYRLATSTDCMTVPLERYIMNLCMEIPAPPPGAFEVQINILDSVIRFWSPPAKLPIAYVALPYRVLFECLDVHNILHLWYCLTMEQKVLLVSSQYSNLTVCAEIFCSLLYPMKWSHLYVPLLPKFLCPMLDAPVPYLCGVTRDNWLHVQQFVSDETIVVDLDRNNLMFGQKTPELPPLPGKKWKKLRNSLEGIAGHLFWRTRGLETEYNEFRNRKLDQRGFKEAARQKGEIRWNEKLMTFDQAFNLQFTPDSENLQNERSIESEQNQWDRVQEAFLRFFVALLKDYRRFLDTPDGDAPPTTNPDGAAWMQWSQRCSFDRDGFIQSQKAEYQPYLSYVTTTQQFDDFITKRLYSPEMPDIIFFDQSIDAKLNRSRLKLKKVDTPFLQSARAHKVLRKFTAVEPYAGDLNVKTPFVYKTWPEHLNPKLFGAPRPIPSIITAEFDRQAALVSRLRSTHSPEPEEAKRLIDFYGSDYDSSPEGMAFTVFFYTYSAVIGREWQEFQKKQRKLKAIANVDVGVDEHTMDIGAAAGEEDGSPDANIEVEVADKDQALSDAYFGLCDGCPAGATTIDNALIYVATSPCPQQMDEFNAQAQAAYETISQLTNSPFKYLQGRSTSLLDGDDGFAEYEEARDVAVAQLDLAFDTLMVMEMRGLSSDPDVFKSLMEACGRCGDTKRALELIEMMKRDGLVADRDVLSGFMAAFAHDEEVLDSPSKDAALARNHRSSDAYSSFLKNNFEMMTRDSIKENTLTTTISESEGESNFSDLCSSSGSDVSASPQKTKQPLGSALMEWLNPRQTSNSGANKGRKKRRRRRSSMVNGPQPVTDRLMKQIALGENLLDFLYPDLKIDAEGDSCPQCSNVMTGSDIIAGWQARAFQDFTTCCPQCRHRFVPRFSVSSSASTFEGSQGFGTPLYCEFLSPWVLRKELSHVIEGGKGVDLILDPEWRRGRQVGATLWWNLIAMFKLYELPFSFLLQGSFNNRLINPVPQD